MSPRHTDPPLEAPHFTIRLERTELPLPGGERETDRRLSVREFARLIRRTSHYVRTEIRAGELYARVIRSRGGRANFELTLQGCIAFLDRRGLDNEGIASFRLMAARLIAARNDTE